MMLVQVTYNGTAFGRLYTFKAPETTTVGDVFSEEGEHGVTVKALGSDYRGPVRSLGLLKQ